MKTWKHFTFVAVLAIVGIAFTTCDDGNNNIHTHDWKWVIATFPTNTVEGLETETCSTCGETRETRNLTLETFLTYFYGTWTATMDNGDLVTLIINANLFKLQFSTIFTLEDLTWDAYYDNDDPDTQDEFPFRYTVTGTCTASPDTNPNIIVGQRYSQIICINAKKNKVYYRSGGIYTRQ